MRRIYLPMQEDAVEEDDILDIIKTVPEDLKYAKENTNGGNGMEKITHEFLMFGK